MAYLGTIKPGYVCRIDEPVPPTLPPSRTPGPPRGTKRRSNWGYSGVASTTEADPAYKRAFRRLVKAARGDMPGTELARLVKCSKESISAYERGHRWPDEGIQARILAALGLTAQTVSALVEAEAYAKAMERQP